MRAGGPRGFYGTKAAESAVVSVAGTQGVEAAQDAVDGPWGPIRRFEEEARYAKRHLNGQGPRLLVLQVVREFREARTAADARPEAYQRAQAALVLEEVRDGVTLPNSRVAKHWLSKGLELDVFTQADVGVAIASSARVRAELILRDLQSGCVTSLSRHATSLLREFFSEAQIAEARAAGASLNEEKAWSADRAAAEKWLAKVRRGTCEPSAPEEWLSTGVLGEAEVTEARVAWALTALRGVEAGRYDGIEDPQIAEVVKWAVENHHVSSEAVAAAIAKHQQRQRKRAEKAIERPTSGVELDDDGLRFGLDLKFTDDWSARFPRDDFEERPAYLNWIFERVKELKVATPRDRELLRHGVAIGVLPQADVDAVLETAEG